MSEISQQRLEEWIAKNTIAVLFFKTKGCGVCHAQLPQVQSIAEGAGVALKAIDLSENLHLASAQMVLSSPVTKVFLREKKCLKKEPTWI